MSKKHKRHGRQSPPLPEKSDNRQQKRAVFTEKAVSNGNRDKDSPVGNFQEQAETMLPPEYHTPKSKHISDTAAPIANKVQEKISDNPEHSPEISEERIAEETGELPSDTPQETDGEKTSGERKEKSGRSEKPEKSERMKKAAFVRQMLERQNAVSQVQSQVDYDDFQSDRTENISDTSINPEATNTPQKEAESKIINIPCTDKNISPENAKRLKKAAYIRQMNERKINAEKTRPEDISEDTADTGNYGILRETPVTDTESPKQSEQTEEQYSFSDTVKTAVEKRFKAQQYEHLKHRRNQTEHSEDNSDSDRNGKNKSDIRSGSVIEAAESAAEAVSAIKSGDGDKVYALPAKNFAKGHLSDGTNTAFDRISTAAGAVKASDSIGGSAVSIGASLAANEVKKYVVNKLKNQKDILSAERKSKKFRFLDNGKTDERMRKTAADKYKKDSFAEKQFQKKREAQRRKKQDIFLKKNKEDISFGAKTDIVKLLIKKKSKKYIAAGGAAVLLPVFTVIIASAIIGSMFSWLSPFEYSLAGDDSRTPTEAKTDKEVLEGYTLLIQNYMDIAQANYYLEYGDWYGGTYVYPNCGIDFQTFLSDYCQEIIMQIQNQYMALINEATDPYVINALYSAMGQAVSTALASAEEQALAEYQQLISSLDDELSAEEKRQHYEIVRSDGGNGISDNAEFNGKPIEGTNFFGNVEIQSDLSAEELLAMTALYKSLKLVHNGGAADDGAEYVYSITPQDIMTFFKETEYIRITAELKHDKECMGRNCKRRLEDEMWVYYCDSDHDNLSGQIEPCISEADLLQKITELTESEDNGFDLTACRDIYEEYLKYIKKTLEISESDYRKFGVADNERAKEFYNKLTDPDAGGIPNNYWVIETPINESEENTNE